jgi:hypothetical protein
MMTAPNEKKKKYCCTCILIITLGPYNIICNWKLGDGLIISTFFRYKYSLGWKFLPLIIHTEQFHAVVLLNPHLAIFLI